jgi:hypothetical protein
MVKSSSRPRKASKFTIDLGPEIDKVVKKKIHTRDVKIRKQKVIILGLKKERDELITRNSEVNDLKMKKQKSHISSLKTIVDDLTSKLKEAEVKLSTVTKSQTLTDVQKTALKLGSKKISINNTTVETARKSILRGKSMYNMKTRTQQFIKQAGLWEDFQELERTIKNVPRVMKVKGMLGV